jgi:hypothetical protein
MKRTLRTTHAIARSPECDALNRCFSPAHGRILLPPEKEPGHPTPWSREKRTKERPELRGVRDDIPACNTRVEGPQDVQRRSLSEASAVPWDELTTQ